MTDQPTKSNPRVEWRALLPASLLVAVAGAQVMLATTAGLTPWKGGGFGILGNLIVGVLGAVLGGWLFGLLGMGSGNLIGQLFVATVGAIALLYLLALVQKRR